MMVLPAPTPAAPKVEEKLAPADAAFVIDFAGRKIGVQLQGKEYLIESRLTQACKDTGIPSMADLIDRCRQHDRMASTALLDSLTTNETSFFRDAHPFESLIDHIVPEMLRSPGKRLQVWNAACSSGQEPYTFAMTMLEKQPAAATPSKLRILATDVSSAMVTRCKEAEYSKFEINRGLPSDLAMKYFDQIGRKYKAKRVLTDLVETRELNLLDPWVDVPRCDIVFLRNVLIYFSNADKSMILDRIRSQVLNRDGCLVLGSSETLVNLNAGFEGRKVGASTFYFPI